MRRNPNRRKMALLIVSMILLLAPLKASAEEGDPPAQQAKSLQQRIDFSSSHILGQSIKSGAVYLMHRKKSDIKNMLEVRESYRDEIIEDYGLEKTAITGDAQEPLEQARDSIKKMVKD